MIWGHSQSTLKRSSAVSFSVEPKFPDKGKGLLRPDPTLSCPFCLAQLSSLPLRHEKGGLSPLLSPSTSGGRVKAQDRQCGAGTRATLVPSATLSSQDQRWAVTSQSCSHTWASGDHKEDLEIE